MVSAAYRVEEVCAEDDIPTACGGGCGWRGVSGDVADIGDCSLTPGDASPVGRCPKCDSLAYLDRPRDRLVDNLPLAFNALSEVTALLENYAAQAGAADHPSVVAAINRARHALDRGDDPDVVEARRAVRPDGTFDVIAAMAGKGGAS